MNTINIPVLALRGMTAFPGETVQLRRGAGDFHFCAGQRYGGRPVVCFW